MRFLPVTLVVLAGAALVAFFVWQARAAEVVGAAVGFCPGPDAYGYVCANGDVYAYVDATQDTRLYEDDGTIRLNLPFEFTFYGVAYQQVVASSNGNLQFTTSNSNPSNSCLEPADGMGAMVAAYWDDLDLRYYGYLETDLIGEEPNRIFVIEWDEIPLFGSELDTVTFEVQLFEGSGDLVLLYQNVETELNPGASSATVGLQDEGPGLALQFSCEQPMLTNGRGLLFKFPEEPNEAVVGSIALMREEVGIWAKKDGQLLWELYRKNDGAALRQVQMEGVQEMPARYGAWKRVDINNDGKPELIWLWRGDTEHPELARLVVIGEDGIWLDWGLGNREVQVGMPAFLGISDLTGDGLSEIILQDTTTDLIWVATVQEQLWQLLPITTGCKGDGRLFDSNRDGLVEIVRDNCANGGRTFVRWQSGKWVLEK